MPGKPLDPRKIAMRSIGIAITIFLASCGVVVGQAPGCPQITVIGPSQLVAPDEPAVFTAKVADLSDISKLGFIWTTSIGYICKGQGTPSVEILVTQEHRGANITASVEVKGLAAGCSNAASETAGVIPVMNIEPLDEFIRSNLEEAESRIDNFYVTLNQLPHYEGLIWVSFNEAESRAKKLGDLGLIFRAIRLRKYDVTQVSFFIVEERPGPTKFTLLSFLPGGQWPDDAQKAKLIKGEDLMRNPELGVPKKN